MTSFKQTCLAGALLLGACQTLPEAAPATALAEAQTGVSETRAAQLINRSEVVAVVSSNDSAVDLEQKAAHWGYDLIRKEPLDGLGLFVLTFDCPPGVDPHVASRELERLSPRADVDANHLYRIYSDASATKVAAPKAIPRHYAHSLIGWPDDGCRANVRVGMLDGEVVAADRLPGDVVLEQRNFVDRSDADSEAARHGTAIAQLLVGPGRLRNATLLSGVVVGTDADGNPYSGVEPMLKALNWMVEADVDVVNISLAGPYNRALERGVNRAVREGVVVVAAVGNAGADAEPQFPAALENVVAATAVDANGNVYEKAVRGRHVDLAAPGVDVWVGDNAGGRYLTGTSIAAPFVAALIAADPTLLQETSMRSLHAKLGTAARDVGEAGPDPVYGLGLVNAEKRCRA
jgi:subtilisin family serine protease